MAFKTSKKNKKIKKMYKKNKKIHEIQKKIKKYIKKTKKLLKPNKKTKKIKKIRKKQKKKYKKCTKNNKKKYKKISLKTKKKSKYKYMRSSQASSSSLSILKVRSKLMLLLCLVLLGKNLVPDEWTTNSRSSSNYFIKPCHHSKLIIKVAIPKPLNSLDVTFHPDGRSSQLVANDMTSNKILNRRRRSINGNRQNVINVIHWNLGSKLWQNKLVEIELLLEEKRPDFCYISEANLWSDVLPHDYTIPGHQIVLPNTMDKIGHARIVLLVRNGINFEVLRNHMDSDIATIWVKTGRTKKQTVAIGGIYREFTILGQQEDQLSWQEKKSRQERRWARILKRWKDLGRRYKCFTLGDINLDYLKWQLPDLNVSNMVVATQEAIETEGFVQLVQKYTRSWRNQEDSLLDQIWSNASNRILKHFNEPRHESDHHVIGLTIATKEPITGGHNMRRRSWKNFSKETFIEKMKAVDWAPVLLETNVTLANSMFEEIYCSILNKEAPMVVIQARTKYNKWITSATKVEMKNRDTARLIAKDTNTDTDWHNFRQLRNLCTKLQRQDRATFFRDTYKRLEEERDTTNIFGITRELLGITRAGPPSCFLVNGIAIRKQKELAEVQMAFYNRKIQEVRESLPKVNQDPLKYLREAFNRWRPINGKPQFNLKTITSFETFKLLNNLKNSHAFGRDEIDGATLKLVAPILAPIIAHLINLSLGTSTVPLKWKVSRILPLLKSRDSETTNPKSFRPVAQIPIICKLTERHIQSQVLTYLEESGQLAANHHSYRNKTSTTTALIQLMDILATGADQNQISAALSIDLSAAFDTVSHPILLEKLQYYGLDKLTLDWFSSYLSDRTAYVVIGSANSTPTTTFCGVPQGSVVGPLLYLLFVNELPSIANEPYCGENTHQDTSKLFGGNCSKCGIMPVFADDCQFVFTSNSRRKNQERMEEIFIKIRDFLNSNGLLMNEAKTGIMEYMTHQKRSKLAGIPPELTCTDRNVDQEGNVTFQVKLLSETKYTRFLGLNIANNLNWEAHILTGKRPLLPGLRSQIGMLSKLKKTCSPKIRLLLANSLILSRLNYAISIWGNSNITLTKKAQIVINTAARFATNLPKSTKQSTLMESCRWLTMMELTNYHSYIQMWKILNWNCPDYMRNMIQTLPNNMISTTRPRLKITAQAFRWSTVPKWNLLPDHLREESSIQKFKKCMKRWIMDQRTTAPEPDE